METTTFWETSSVSTTDSSFSYLFLHLFILLFFFSVHLSVRQESIQSTRGNSLLLPWIVFARLRFHRLIYTASVHRIAPWRRHQLRDYVYTFFMTLFVPITLFWLIIRSRKRGPTFTLLYRLTVFLKRIHFKFMLSPFTGECPLLIRTCFLVQSKPI